MVSLMIDFHAHILPDLDDGASFWEESLAMAKKAKAEGIKGIILTPHYIERRYRNTRRRIMSKFEEMRYRLAKAEIAIEVYPGAEVRIEPELLTWLQKGELMTINDGKKYLLVELPFTGLPAYIDKILDELPGAGITPIIAHPERHQAITNNPDWLNAALAKGVLFQINTGSFTGAFGLDVQKAAVNIATRGMIHFLGSDAHSLPHRPATLIPAVSYLEGILSPGDIKRITTDNPRAVLKGEKILNPI